MSLWVAVQAIYFLFWQKYLLKGKCLGIFNQIQDILTANDPTGISFEILKHPKHLFVCILIFYLKICQRKTKFSWWKPKLNLNLTEGHNSHKHSECLIYNLNMMYRDVLVKINIILLRQIKRTDNYRGWGC